MRLLAVYSDFRAEPSVAMDRKKKRPKTEQRHHGAEVRRTGADKGEAANRERRGSGGKAFAVPRGVRSETGALGGLALPAWLVGRGGALVAHGAPSGGAIGLRRPAPVATTFTMKSETSRSNFFSAVTAVFVTLPAESKR